MPSKLIPAAFDDPTSEYARAFARHLRELLGLSQSDLDRCLKVLSDVRAARTADEETKIIDRVSAACSAEQPHLTHAISVLSFFVKQLLSTDLPDDDYEHWVDDLLDQQMLDADHAGDLRPLLERLVAEQLPSLRIQTRRRQTAGGVLPSIKALGYTVELRSVREKIYLSGTDVSEFEPEILGTVEVASIHIQVDQGPFDHIYFQADESDVDYMISHLQAIKKDWAALRKYLQVSDDAGDARDA